MARLFAVLIILYPLSFVRVDQRGSALLPMVIQLERTSPAFAAFEDILNSYPEDAPEIHVKAKQTVWLAAGTVYKPQVPEQREIPVIRMKLEPMRISRMKEVIQPVAWDDSENLPSLSERKKILLSQISRDVLVQPSAAELAQKLVKEELARRTPGLRKVPTHNGGTIIVRKPEPSSRSPYVAYNDRQEERDPGFVKEGKNENSLLLTGDVHIYGLPVDLGRERTYWRLFRRYNGQVQETGSINIQQAQFQIRVGSRRGILVAELSDGAGRVIGRGEASLQGDSALALDVNPIEATTVASYAPGFTDSAVDVSRYSGDSRFYVEAATKSHVPTMALGFLPELQKIPLYTLKSIKAFYEIVRSFYRPLDLTNRALLWGEVTQNGKPVSGAEVEIASHQGKVVYFNEIGIPRKDVHVTTSSGQFAVVNVEEGVQAVRVNYLGQTFPARVIPSSAGKITQVDLEVPSVFLKHDVHFFSLAKPEENVRTTFRLVGADQGFDISTSRAVSLPFLQDGVMVEWDAGPGYELMRTQLPPLAEKKDIGLPVISADWAVRLIQSAGKNLDRRLGWTMGFSEGTDAEVRLKNGGGFYDLVYFDRDLNLWNGSTLPAGGGFIMFNVPLGYQTVEVQPIQSAQAYAESFVSEPYFLYLVGSQGFLQSFGQKNP